MSGRVAAIRKPNFQTHMQFVTSSHTAEHEPIKPLVNILSPLSLTSVQRSCVSVSINPEEQHERAVIVQLQLHAPPSRSSCVTLGELSLPCHIRGNEKENIARLSRLKRYRFGCSVTSAGFLGVHC